MVHAIALGRLQVAREAAEALEAFQFLTISFKVQPFLKPCSVYRIVLASCG